jgi:hypothetical protein
MTSNPLFTQNVVSSDDIDVSVNQSSDSPARASADPAVSTAPKSEPPANGGGTGSGANGAASSGAIDALIHAATSSSASFASSYVPSFVAASSSSSSSSSLSSSSSSSDEARAAVTDILRRLSSHVVAAHCIGGLASQYLRADVHDESGALDGVLHAVAWQLFPDRAPLKQSRQREGSDSAHSGGEMDDCGTTSSGTSVDRVEPSSSATADRLFAQALLLVCKFAAEPASWRWRWTQNSEVRSGQNDYASGGNIVRCFSF